MFFLYTFLIVIFISVIIFIPLTLLFRRKRASKKGITTIGFFHPYCNAGGGGERVLWCAIKALQDKSSKIDVIVYTGDTDASPEDIINNVKQKFNINLPRPVHFVYLKNRHLVEAYLYPVFTLLGQSFGSFLLGIEAIWSLLPDVYIDTMGYAFTMPLFKLLGGCKVACYVHYPIITKEMLQQVSNRVAAHNNRVFVAHNSVLTLGKLIYYKILALVYGLAGRTADVVMVNSSWTESHINSLWNHKGCTYRVYPPCDVSSLKTISFDSTSNKSEVRIVSVGQFRPEKDHPLQLKSLKELKEILSPEMWSSVKLVFIGSCRNSEDEVRVNSLKKLCQELSVENNVEFKVNVSYEELKQELAKGIIGLHTMWNEHFGIGIVECMAAGLIMVAHRSGGPKLDIINDQEENRTGYLAETEKEYAQAFLTVINTSETELQKIRQAARLSVDRFSVASFEKDFLNANHHILPLKS